MQRARYHYDKDVYGYRTPRDVPADDYTPEELENRNRNANLLRLVYAFRSQGHRLANLDPLGLTLLENIRDILPERYGLKNPAEKFNLAGILHVGSSDPKAPLQEASIDRIMEHLRGSYCGRIGFEFTHIPVKAERQWFAKLVESYEKRTFSPEEKRYFSSLLTKSEVFDHFMAKKFPQVKRYGLQGAESMMIVMSTLLRESSANGISDIVLCMPHRGRLNLLTDLLEFPAEALFHKLKGNSEFPKEYADLNGDVLSHLAISKDIDVGGPEKVHVSMLHNPSHLETANPVALGKARARQMHLFEAGTENNCFIGDRVMCVQLHGDAAFAGQGVVTETLGLANLPHYTAGGSVHVIVNNQIGYTTPAMNARSTTYTSDVAKMINCPVIHVNADHPEDVAYATAIAFEYRHRFRKDVILDMISYRRLGHNELDEPAYTQPLMYQKIRALRTVPAKYEDKLFEEGVFQSRADIDAVRDWYNGELERKLEASLNYEPELEAFKGKWASMVHPTSAVTKLDTGVPVETLKKVGIASVERPSDFTVHSRLARYHIENRVTRVSAGTGLDWATAEAMAFGSLMLEGYHVRISGQDVGRGTFSQRHVMLVDSSNERTIIPLNRMVPPPGKQGKIEIANSHLSEYAVMGFEYGVSLETPNRLCIWEAQFGDFFNGAQIVIDTLISSGETKWMRQSGLVLLLPHGYDGAGPEHSSSHIERFLQLCDTPFDVNAKETNPNMHVVNPTTPAQYFHLLRRQLQRNYRKPLIVAAPKVLLRHPAATSDLADMAPGTTFLPVLGDPLFADAEKAAGVQRVCFLSGKLYYDLVKERNDRGLDDKVAFVRLEEIAPFPADDLAAQIAQFPNASEFWWVQEESQNQGAYSFVAPRLEQLLGGARLHYHGRAPSAAPATGIGKVHKKEVADLMSGTFAGL